MSLGHSFSPSPLETVGWRLPWQFRVRPALFVTVFALVAILVMTGGLILARRLTGALSTDLSPDVILLLALAVTITLSCARVAWRRSFPLETPEDLSTADQLLGWGSSAALALLAVGSCYPANRTVDWLIWLPILVADQMWRQNFFDAGEPWMPENGIENNFSAPITPTIADIPKLDNVVQQLYRLKDGSDEELVYGTVRADFVTGQRTAVVHVGFCPPLTYLPEIEAEALPGSLAKIKVVQALAHGTRLEVRLPTTAQSDCQIWIDMAARPIGACSETNSATQMA